MSAIRIRSALRKIKSPHRAARSRGFGVHSPFAFRFVREVLTQRYVYYCYPELEKLCSSCGANKRVVKATFRIALWFRPIEIETIGATNPAIAEALHLGNPTPAESAHCADRCIVGIDSEGVKTVKARWSESEHGMLFTDSTKIAVFVDSARLPHQSFSIILPA